MTYSSGSGHVVAIQVGDSELEVHRDMSSDDCIDLVSRSNGQLAEQLRVTEERLRAISEEVVTDPDKAVEYFLLQYSQSRADELLAADLEDLPPEDHRKRIDQYHRYSPVGSVVLYRDVEFRGGLKFFTRTWPNFRWTPYRFNDTASSGKAFGANIIFEHSWYRGRRLYLIGYPYTEMADFRDFEFNDIASSFVAVPSPAEV